MAEYVFGAGQLYATPLPTIAVPNPAPRRFGVTQDASLDISSDVKELYGAKQFALDVRSGKFKITCSAKFAQINMRQLNDLLLGGTSVPGQVIAVDSELHSIPAVSTYTATASMIMTGNTFEADQGVAYAATSVLLTQVAGTPTQGQYSVSDVGVYTFAAADASAQVVISYTYTSSTLGYTSAMPNRFMGTTVYFQTFLTLPANGEQLNCRLWKCMSSKLTMATKIDDYMIPEFSIMAMDPGTGFPITFYSSE
jgi:hypothetical protein